MNGRPMLVLGLVLAAGGAGGGSLDRAGEPPRQGDPQVLAGPEVAETPRRASIVTRDFSGRVIRTECASEEAAAALLELDEPARGAVDRVLMERVALIDRLVRENVDLLADFASAQAAGPWEQLGLWQQAYQRLEPLRSRPTLRASLRAVLPGPAAAEFDRLLDEYWQAIADELAGKPGDNGKPRARWQVVVEERVQSLGREFERSFHRQLRSGDLVYHILLDGMGLTADQQERLRAMVAEFIEKHGIEGATPGAWARLGLAVMANLDERQRLEFIRRVKLLMAGQVRRSE